LKGARMHNRSRKTWCLSMLAAVLLCGSARPSVAAERHMLWAVAGASNTVYLLGSIHLLREDMYPLPEAIMAAYADSEILVTEVDIAAISDVDAQIAMMSRGMLEAGTQLSDVVSPKTYDAAKKALEGMGLDVAMFSAFKPWMLSMTLSVAKLKTLGFSPENGIDLFFDSLARRDGKERASLETVDFQIELFDKMAPEDQDALLAYTIDEFDMLESEADRLMTAWVDGRDDDLAALLLEGFEPFPHLAGRLITDRNRTWLGQIQRYLTGDHNVLVIVGAGHLVGAEGVVSLLRGREYSVSQQ
jgi:uncharacterized protein YbaP (TraB family)